MTIEETMKGIRVNITPVIKGSSNILINLPDLVRYGSKPEREIEKDPDLLDRLYEHFRSFDDLVAYPPNQVFIGNLRPEALYGYERPWTDKKTHGANRFSESGEIVPEEEYFGWLKLADMFSLVSLENGFLSEVIKPKLAALDLIVKDDIEKLGDGFSAVEIEAKTAAGIAIPLYFKKTRLVGCVEQGNPNDKVQTPGVMLENLTNKASGIIALRHVLKHSGANADEIDYVIACDEEAVGDRYQRGGGNMGKSIAGHTGCVNASGSDVKAFCCGPAHAIVISAALVASGVYRNVAVVGGGSVAKLGMKYAGSLKHGMPITEDQIGAFAIIIGDDDGKSPKIRLDAIGKHSISAGASAQAIYRALVVEPLERIDRGILDIDKYATELHNPDITEPNGNGNVARSNYRVLAAFAVMRGEMEKSRMDDFERKHGMPGYSPTQGHVASAVPFVIHARSMIMDGEIGAAMFVGKGSMFLGKMTDLADGVSFIIEQNQAKETGGKLDPNRQR